MKYGVGRWIQILETGLLPGKLIQQLNGQTQRLLGQQSLAAYTGLQVDIDRIRADNDRLVDAERKNGLVINSGRKWCARGHDRATAPFKQGHLSLYMGLRSEQSEPCTLKVMGCLASMNAIQIAALLPRCSQPDKAAEAAAAGGGKSQVSGTGDPEFCTVS